MIQLHRWQEYFYTNLSVRCVALLQYPAIVERRLNMTTKFGPLLAIALLGAIGRQLL
jgi:hypothetical protein